MAFVHCTEDSFQLRLYLEDHGRRVSPLTVHLVVHKVLGSDGLVLLHIEDSRLLPRVEGYGDS
jgi:hypothetical protein